MSERPITDKDRKLAQRCMTCPVCKGARKNPRSLLNWFVRRIESRVCPYCQAYERVYGRKAHEPLPEQEA